MRRRLLVVLALAAGGCLGPRQDPSAFFLLSPMSAPSQDMPLSVTLGVGPVTIPGYLDRSQIVVRLSDNEVAVAESDRWAEPLVEGITRTLEGNLQTLLPGSSFVDYPWYDSDAPAYAIELVFRRFEADPAGVAVLQADWRLTRRDSLVLRGAVSVEEAADSPGRAASVAAQSRALAELGRQIANSIRTAATR
jgi:uncharacterized lipoprotein YmbA